MGEQSRCKSILIIEDDRDIRDTLRLILELEGYSPLVAKNGREGFEALQGCARPCLILLDLMMPVMNGWEFLDAHRRDVTIATIPVVVVSAIGEAAARLGAQATIKKPVELDSLLKIVRKYCGEAESKVA
jgi:CheY-like chemotaxis protein